MKKQISLFFAALLISITSLMAQEARQKMPSPEEKTKATMEKLSPLNLDDATKIKTQAVFTDFYTAAQKSMQEMRAAGNMDRQAMMESHKKLAEERDAKLKTLFTADQMKKWTDEIEPTTRMQRPPKNQ